MDQGFLLSRDSANRLSRMLNAFERDRLGPVYRPDRGDFGFGRTGSITQTVEVTGGEISPGLYPGKVKNWNNTTQAWVDGPACRVREASGGALVFGSVFVDARLVGQDTVLGVNYLVFQVSAGSAISTEAPTLEYVIPWRILPITFVDSEFQPGGGTYDYWVYVKDMRYFDGDAGTYNPRVGLVREPNHSVFTANPGMNGLYILGDFGIPFYSVDGNTSGANWKAASFAIAWYLKQYGWKPAALAAFKKTTLAYYTFGGVNYPVYWWNEIPDDLSYFFSQNRILLSRSFEADLKYALCNLAGWNEPSGYVDWSFRLADLTQKTARVWFPDRFRLLNTANTGIQRCLVTPSYPNKIVNLINGQQPSNFDLPIPVNAAANVYLISQVRHTTSPAPSTTPAT